MKIVCIGWGSLVWDPGVLRCVGDWQTDGPTLPLEFARVWRDGRLALVLTPICPHTLTHRPLIVPAEAEIDVTLTSKDDGAMATMDGQVVVAISQGDTIEIKVSEHRTRLIRFPETRYYEVLREKLKWGDG